MNAFVTTSVLAFFAILLIWFLASYWLAQRGDAALKAREPDTLSYKWGFFLGYSGIFVALIACAVVFVLAAVWEWQFWMLVTLAYAVAFGVASWGVLLRRRWGWLWQVPLSMNPGLWAFNSVYASNRWQEFARS